MKRDVCGGSYINKCIANSVSQDLTLAFSTKDD